MTRDMGNGALYSRQGDSMAVGGSFCCRPGIFVSVSNPKLSLVVLARR